MRCAVPWIALALLALPYSISADAQTSNALDRINFGDTSSSATSEGAHGFVSQGNPTGTGGLGLTWREIVPSPSAPSNGSMNRMLTFTMKCDPALQNHLTIQIWGSDIIPDVLYLYTPQQGYQVSSYYGSAQPELDFQDAVNPILPGRFVYETVEIPLSMTQGKTSVSLTINAAQSYYYYSGATTDLPAGATSRPIYSAFTHTAPALTLASTDPQGTAPTAAAATPATLNSAYLASELSGLSTYVANAESNQVYGPAWTAAIAAGTVPPQIYGYFATGRTPTDNNTLAQWLNNAATDTSNSNNVNMERLEMLAFAYTTPNLLTRFYQDPTTEQEIVAGLDAYSYMEGLNGSWGDMYVWSGVGATTASASNPYGRLNVQQSPIEGAGTWSLGSAILKMQADPAFRTALNQPISSTLEPGVLRYQAYQAMLSSHVTFLAGYHGFSPAQDLLEARSYVYANLALRALDAIYGTSLARSNAQMYTDYLNETSGLALNPSGNYWISAGGLGLEDGGTGNGSYDGGYGRDDVMYLVGMAKILRDNGIETTTVHPVLNVALNAVNAFSNFISPSLAVAGSGYAATLRVEEPLTYRKNLSVGEIFTGGNYFAAEEFGSATALHAFYLEAANGLTWNILPIGAGHADDTADNYMHEYADYATLCGLVSSSSDTTGVAFLDEPTHGDAVFADPTGTTLAIRHGSERLKMVLDWRDSGAVNSIARVHDTTPTMDRIATVSMPGSAATGAVGSYASGAFETLYLGEWGRYQVGLNWQSNSANMALAPDFNAGTAVNIATGALYDLTQTSVIPVPALGGLALYRFVPTATLSQSTLVFLQTNTAQTLTLSNSGDGPLLVGSISFNGNSPGDFSETSTCSGPVPAGGSCLITVTYRPLTAFGSSAYLAVHTSASANPLSVPLSSYTGQTITFPALAPVTYGTAPITLAATTTAGGLAVGYTVLSGPGTVSGSLLTVTGAGTIVVQASQPGSSYFSAATPVSQSLTVKAAPAGTTVSFGAAANVYGIFNNGSAVTNGGLDTASYAYSANLLGTGLVYAGVPYSFGTAGSADAASSTTLSLPSGNYTTLNFLGTAVFGSQPSQTFVVTYTDGTTSTFTQSVSDWGSPQSYSGETNALTMAYRDTPAGAQQAASWYLYGYSFTLNSAKTVKSFTLPSSRNVVVLAVTLSGQVAAGTAVSFGSAANIYGIFSNGSTVTNGGLDTSSYAYSAALVGTGVTVQGVPYTFGAAGTANAASATTLPLPTGNYATLNFLATAVYGSQPSQTFVVTYTDGTTSTFTQSISDWGSPQSYGGETNALTMSYRLTPTGAQQAGSWNLYGYSFTLNSAKTVKSFTLPNSRNVVVLAVTLSGQVASSTPVGLGSAATIYGIFNNGSTVTSGGLDTASYAYSSTLLGAGLTFQGLPYSFGAAGSADAASSTTLSLPSGSYTTLNFLGTAVFGNQPSQTFVVTYTDGTTSTFTQSMSDWGSPQAYAGESSALTMAYRLTSTGAQQAGSWNLYGYSFALNSAKTVKSFTLPNSRNVVVLAVTLR